jgi:hypothetical protein
VQLLAPGGVAVVLFWPPDTESSGPFHALHGLLRDIGARDREWDEKVVPSVLRAGGRLLCDARLAFPMQHADADAIWQAFTRLGPLRALALTRGQQLIDELGVQFLGALPAGPIEHAPAARLLVIARD